MKLTTGAALVLALALGACSNMDFKKTKSGMPYKIIAGNGGTKIDTGNIVKLQVVQKIRDSVLFSTFKTGLPVYVPIDPMAVRPYDFTEVLPQLKQGDSLYTVQLIDTFLAQSQRMGRPQALPPQFKKGDKIETGIRVISVFKNQQEAQKDQAAEQNLAFDRDTAVQNQLKKDEAAIQTYLQSHNVNAQKMGKGTYVQVLSPGTGATIDDGKYVSLKYTGSTFQGHIFDTNADTSKGHTEPLVYQVGTPGMIKGFDEGIRSLHEGAKAKLFIPSILAYGPQPPSPELQPFENLIFDIDVLKVSDQPIQQQMPGMPPRAVPDSPTVRKK